MIWNWFISEGGIVLSYWFLVTLAGVAALPICWRFLGALPDRGTLLARSVGMLLVGYVFWLLGSFGLLRNTPGAIILSWVLVLILGWVLYVALPGPEENRDPRAWLREHRTALIAGELIFLLALFGWALVRAHLPNLSGTEKPMELAFMSAVQRTEVFPPNDPWLSGYSISYYYFGYVMASMLAMMSGITSTIGFNMMISLLFALTSLNAFAVVYNLISARGAQVRRLFAVRAAVLGTVFVVLLGNFQLPFIELPYQSGYASDAYFEWWGTQQRESANPVPPGEGELVQVGPVQIADLTTWDFWWWFRASRVINDREMPTSDNPQGPPVGANVIDEFPQFSFLLADNHPHVLALPFSALAIGLALNLLLRRRDPTVTDTLFYGVCLGGLVFLNAWDGPIYMVVLVGADLLRRIMRHPERRLTWGAAGLSGSLLFTFAVMAFVLYLPFFVSFRSQAAGFLPNLIWPTAFRHLFLMFGPFMLLIVPFMLLEAWRARRQMNWISGWVAVLVLLALLVFAMVFLVGVASAVPALRNTVMRYIVENGGTEAVTAVVLRRRAETILTTLALSMTLVFVVARLLPRNMTSEAESYSADKGFALLLLAAGTGLVLVPEFIYLGDNFRVRINTIFKFYYQAWLMFAVVSAYAVYVFVGSHERTAPPLRVAHSVVLASVLFLGMLYPVFGIHNRTQVESGRVANAAPLTLDGGPTLVSINDYDAIMCLNERVQGDDVVLAEAIGPPYRSWAGRAAVLSGIPNVLGWEGHQSQWRGSAYSELVGTRRADVEQLYNDPRWDAVVGIIERYEIDYIFYGDTERFGNAEQDRYAPAGEDKFRENLTVVCQHETSLFYEVTPRALEVAGANRP